MTWTNVSKPTTDTFVPVNGAGREIYDDPNVFFDDSSVFFDGGDPNQWTDVAKPIYPIESGLYYGFGAFTYSESEDDWTRISKPN